MRSFDELFARYPSRFQPLSPLVSLAGGGGLSGAKLWRFRAEHGELLLRAWPPEGPGRRHIEQVHRWLSLDGRARFCPRAHSRSRRPVRSGMARVWSGKSLPGSSGAADPSRPPASEHLCGSPSRASRRSISGWPVSKSRPFPRAFGKGTTRSFAWSEGGFRLARDGDQASG